MIDVNGYRARDVRLWDSEKREFIKLKQDDFDDLLIPHKYRSQASHLSIMEHWFRSANTTRTNVRFDEEVESESETE